MLITLWNITSRENAAVRVAIVNEAIMQNIHVFGQLITAADYGICWKICIATLTVHYMDTSKKVRFFLNWHCL
ncbi:unnamed protein product [Schistosoma haematobium]|nr:unnamed protein product [Schistosoma haematobium]CAH8678958.1 unnamed protein product [Schistosoma haematobium]